MEQRDGHAGERWEIRSLRQGHLPPSYWQRVAKDDGDRSPPWERRGGQVSPLGTAGGTGIPPGNGGGDGPHSLEGRAVETEFPERDVELQPKVAKVLLPHLLHTLDKLVELVVDLVAPLPLALLLLDLVRVKRVAATGVQSLDHLHDLTDGEGREEEGRRKDHHDLGEGRRGVVQSLDDLADCKRSKGLGKGVYTQEIASLQLPIPVLSSTGWCQTRRPPDTP